MPHSSGTETLKDEFFGGQIQEVMCSFKTMIGILVSQKLYSVIIVFTANT